MEDSLYAWCHLVQWFITLQLDNIVNFSPTDTLTSNTRFQSSREMNPNQLYIEEEKFPPFPQFIFPAFIFSKSSIQMDPARFGTFPWSQCHNPFLCLWQCGHLSLRSQFSDSDLYKFKVQVSPETTDRIKSHFSSCVILVVPERERSSMWIYFYFPSKETEEERKKKLCNSSVSPDSRPMLFASPSPPHSQQNSRYGGRKWPLEAVQAQMIYSTYIGIITGPDFCQDTSQQCPPGPGPEPEGRHRVQYRSSSPGSQKWGISLYNTGGAETFT